MNVMATTVKQFPSGCCGNFKHTIKVIKGTSIIISITGAGKSPEEAKKLAFLEYETIYGIIP